MPPTLPRSKSSSPKPSSRCRTSQSRRLKVRQEPGPCRTSIRSRWSRPRTGRRVDQPIDAALSVERISPAALSLSKGVLGAPSRPTVVRQAHHADIPASSSQLRAPLDGRVGPLGGADVELPRPADLLLGVLDHLFPLRDPAHSAC